MSFDYSQLLNADNTDYFTTWKDIYDDSKSLPDNFLGFLTRSVYLPLNHYKIVAAYAFIPSALASVVPYLFLWGVSGSGKSTVGKLIANLHGIDINSSSDTFAGIRNSLNDRRKGWISVPSNDPSFPNGVNKEVEVNTCMVWDDIDPSVFLSKGDIYRLFKFGYDKSSDKIEVSSEVTGENHVFHCFCPKTFSSISPLHLHEQLKELRRRLIVIPTKRIEDLSDARKTELGILGGMWQESLLDISNIKWKGFSDLFEQFWTLEMAKGYLAGKKALMGYIKGLNSQERAICVDLIATGVTCGIWSDEDEAIADVKEYWSWFKGEVKIGESPLLQLLKQLVQQEAKNAKNGGIEVRVSNQQVKAHCEMWYEQGQLLERPSSKLIRDVMNELGYRLIIGGIWIKS